jgi:hypothetical protein
LFLKLYKPSIGVGVVIKKFIVMAKQKGLIELEGTIGELNFYYRKGKPVVRKSGGGFNGKAIKTKASMVRVRENGSEFGSCMRVVTAFKSSLAVFLTQFKDGGLHHRLVSLFTKIKSWDTVSERGQRTVAHGLNTPAGIALLDHYVVTSGKNLERVLGHPYRFDFATGFQLDGFDGNHLHFPGGSTHLKLVAGYLRFDFDNLSYQLVVSEAVYLDKASAGTYALGPQAPNSATGKAIGVVFAQYVQNVNGVYYPLKQANEVVLEVVCLD